MSRIVSKLNLNKTPQLVENNSLIMAKNIRLLEDGSIGPDTSLQDIQANNFNITVDYVGQIVGLNNKVYIFKESGAVLYNSTVASLIKNNYPNESFVQDEKDISKATFSVDKDNIVLRNGKLFEDIVISQKAVPNPHNRVRIYEYDEITGIINLVRCAWTYHGGKINGCVSVNNTGEEILTICEYDVPNNYLIPIKHINLSNCSLQDNESIYTQAPNIPITNLLFKETYSETIPNGVYQFFIRYEIRDDFYTNWFPCSTELSTGVRKVVDTIQGSIRYADLRMDSDVSFVFDVNHLYKQYTKNYKSFQIGFILSHDNGVFARSWKSFPMDKQEIYFDYDNDSIKEINIDDLLNTNYDIYNVKNICNYKNRLYISNFVETDFNDNNIELSDFANNIDIKLELEKFDTKTGAFLNNYELHSVTINGNNYYDSYYNNVTTVSISEIYGNTDWCNIEEKINSETPYNFSFLHKRIFYDYNEELDNYSTYIRELHEVPYNIQNYQLNKHILFKLYILDDNNNEIQLLDKDYSLDLQKDIITENLYSFNTYEKLKEEILDIIKDKIIGIKDDKFYLKKGTSIVKADNIYYTFGYLEYVNTTEETIPKNPTNYQDYDKYIYYNYSRKICTASLKVENIYNVNYGSSLGFEETQTLLPFTDYDFYCHFVKQNGITTNGYPIRSLKIKQWAMYNNAIPPETATPVSEIPTTALLLGDNSVNDIISVMYSDGNVHNMRAIELPANYAVYPKFIANNKLPSEYVGYFISMYKHKNNVCELFDKHKLTGTNYIFHCLECDALLFTKYNNIDILNYRGDSIIDDKYARYITSSNTNTEDIDKFGDNGIVYLEKNKELYHNRFWIIGNKTVTNNNKTLVKVTPIRNDDIKDTKLYDLFLQGYFCNVKKMKHRTEKTKFYINGSDVYNMTINQSNAEGINLELNENKLAIDYSPSVNLHSNYNLNYLSLTQDLPAKLRTYDVKDVTTTTTENGGTVEETITTQKNQIIYSVDSSIASFISTLEKTFKDYTRKLYYEIKENSISKFDNVIRCSNIDIDEKYRYIYRFNATDYYNVPANRGIITNLISIANSIYVHCEHSLYKFSDNKTLNAEQEEVTLQENDIFNSGISEVFDAQYGYAGLANKEQSLITHNVYVFYDAYSKTIYAYGGDQQITSISDSIKKLIDDLQPTDVRFVADERHNRFFVNLINNLGNVCLSFNFAAKSFISVHDIDFKFGFHTRQNTYFVSNTTRWYIYKIVDSVLIGNNLNYNVYGNCYNVSLIRNTDYNSKIREQNPNNPSENSSINSCVDILINTSYEKIKVIDSLSWICSEITDYSKNSLFVAEESMDRTYPGHQIRIYSDTCYTELIPLLDNNNNPKISNNERNIDDNGNIIANPNSWQYIRYNCGIWSMNYFRDAKKYKDEFNYKNENNGIYGNPNDIAGINIKDFSQRQYYTNESSLLYGKYFVVRFIFTNKNFKLENIIVKMSNYGKTE